MSIVRRSKRGMTRGKSFLKHSSTLLATIGPATSPITRLSLVQTTVGARDEDGSSTTITSSRSTEQNCFAGDIVKYINIHIQTSPTDQTSTRQGWLEYAVIQKKEDVLDPVNTNLGTQTLGDICTQYLRDQCLWTGFIPIGTTMPNGAELKIKIPPKFCRLTRGDEFVLYVAFRSNNSADVTTNANRVILSYNFKSYG